MRYYPVGIPTLCRYEHFYRCVESLKHCTHADKTELVIGIDYPTKEAHWDGHDKIVNYLAHLEGFAKLTVFKHSRNLGAIGNYKFIENYMYSHYDAAIFSEDDNEFSPNFLDYMNKGLELYKDNQKVMAICGYMYLYHINQPLQEAFPAYGYSAWGVGQWKCKKYIYEQMHEKDYLDCILLSWEKTLKLFKLRPTNVNSLLTMKIYHQSYGDCFKVSEHILEQKVSIFPKSSKVRNWGHDGSGEHCTVENEFSMQVIDKNLRFDFSKNVLEQEPINFSSYMDISNIKRIIIIFRYTIYRILGIDILSFYYRKKF
ncbi:MAG: hypothetical protein IJ635_11760 [Bacteroidaceae bacterium]|nr:hypothetical protein [Bacteroidaceae bacterium]